MLIEEGSHRPGSFAMSHVIFPFAYVIVHADSVVGAVSGVHVTFE